MKSTASELIPILRSNTQGALLAELLLWPTREASITDLAARVGVAAPTILRDVNRLVAGRFVLERRSGRSRLIRANVDHPIYRPLRDVVAYGFGPLTIVPWALSQVEGIEEAWIFGSWAERWHGVPGPDPQDIDVLVVGSADPTKVYAAALDASRVIGKDVNATVISTERWARGDDGFVETVRERPRLAVDLTRST
jgi:DNA-binding transcriptional ArsR family regulator